MLSFDISNMINEGVLWLTHATPLNFGLFDGMNWTGAGCLMQLLVTNQVHS